MKPAREPEATTHGSVLYRSPREHYRTAVSADGVYIHDADGRAYLDMSGGAAVSCLGHSHPDVVAAVSEQLGKLAFAHTSFFTSEPQERLAARIAERFGSPGALVYFLTGGSEANETAFKIAWQYWVARGKTAKKIIISREHSYHGNTFGTLSASGNPGRRRESAAPLVDWPRIDPCYAYRDQRPDESAETYAERAAQRLDAAITEAGADNVAAFICEPVVGSSLGVVPAAPTYLRHVREICDRHDVLFIADEIMCGSGRTGTYFAHEQDEARPDIVTLAKGIGGGYMPLAATVVSDRVADGLTQTGFAHGHTYIGHATSCAAGLAVQDVIDRDGLLARTRDTGERFMASLSGSLRNHANVGEMRGRGLFIGIELVADRDSKAGFDGKPGLASAIRKAALEEGLICYPGSVLIDGLTVPHILLAPPMIIEDEHVDECIGKLERTLGRVLDT